jgi:hypothetical protein
MKLGDKAAAFEMCERAEKANPTATDAMYGPFATEILARVAAGTNEPGQAINALAKLRSVPYRPIGLGSSTHTGSASTRSDVRSASE